MTDKPTDVRVGDRRLCPYGNLYTVDSIEGNIGICAFKSMGRDGRMSIPLKELQSMELITCADASPVDRCGECRGVMEDEAYPRLVIAKNTPNADAMLPYCPDCGHAIGEGVV